MDDREIKEVSSGLQDTIIEISNFLFTHPELGDCEFESSRYLAELLRGEGFRVTAPVCGLETAFRAEWGSGSPKIAFLAEYDALPGYGPEKKPAHACGHNWIGASAVGAALILSRLRDFHGTAVVLGTPAEETAGRKIDMLKQGAFEGIDAVFQMHLNDTTNLNACALAMDSWCFEFLGRPSHAASHPFDGINALDAVNLTFAGISALRQQLRPDVRIHGIVTDGGQAANVIPGRAECKFYVRSEKRAFLNEVSEKVKNCARGAALMTGAKLNISSFENSYDDLMVNSVLRGLMHDCLQTCGITGFSLEKEQAGSTDIGNVSHRLPTFYGNIGVGNASSRPHEEAFLSHVNAEEAHEKLLMTARAFALASLRLSQDSGLLDKVTQSFQEQS